MKDRLHKILKWRTVHRAQAVILMYHRVADLPPDLYRLSVTPENFSGQLAFIKSHCHPISLLEMASCLREGRVPARAVAVTFDDGYANNLTNALPLLDAYNIPATVFIASGALGSNELFWWDELEHIILQGIEVPASLELNIEGKDYLWQVQDQDAKVKAFYKIHRLLRLLTAETRNALMNTIREWAEENSVSEHQWHNLRPLTHNELRQLADSPMIDIGGHTVNHPLLEKLDEETQRYEIESSYTTLNSLLSDRIKTFSYPYGSYNSTTLKICKQLGFEAATSTESRGLNRNDSLLALPRITVEDVGHEIFAQRLEECFAGDR